MQVRRIKVLALVTDAFGGFGGIAQYNRDFLRALANSDVVQDVNVLPRGGDKPIPPLPACVRQQPAVKNKILYSLRALRASLAGPDIIICGHLFMAPLAVVLMKVCGARLWIQVHGIEAWEELPPLYQKSIVFADLITSVSRYTRRRLLHWAEVNRNTVKILPPTVSARRFAPAAKPTTLMASHDLVGKKIILTISRLAKSEGYKGQDRVIRVLPDILRKHSNAVYLIGGDGDDRHRLEELAFSMGLANHVKFIGMIRESDLADTIRLADVFVMPSTGEGFGIVFLEALRCGIPVVAGNQDGSRDPLADGTLGQLVDPENSSDLSNAICSALLEPQKPNLEESGRFRPCNFNAHVGLLLDHLISLSSANRKP
jgi:glycosyltransferase involved in cell wall biosynthesis